VFQGNAYNDERTTLAATLYRMRAEGIDVGLYGNLKGAVGNTHYDFSTQAAINRQAKIVVGDTFPNTRAFVSNRLFQVLSQGGFILQQYSPSLDEYTRLQAGTHYVAWRDLDDLQRLIRLWLQPDHDEGRRRIAKRGKDFVRDNFSYDAQVSKLFRVLLPDWERKHGYR